MVEPGSELDLSKEAVGAKGRRQIRVENLERDYAIMLAVLRQVNGRHATTSELTVYRISVGKRSPEAFDRKRHAMSGSGGGRLNVSAS